MATLGEDQVNARHGQVLSSGIYQLLLQRRMLDVTITCGGEAIMAHKAVLVAFSKFLDTVFSGQGDDCDVLNMDNLGLDFEAIRAVIFFMYKGAVDMERCGEEAFLNAAKVLAVDTTTQYTKQETVAPPLQTPAPAPVAQPSKPEPQPLPPGASLLHKSPARVPVKDQMTMTDTPRLLKLTRHTQTEQTSSWFVESKDTLHISDCHKQTEAAPDMRDQQCQTSQPDIQIQPAESPITSGSTRKVPVENRDTSTNSTASPNKGIPEDGKIPGETPKVQLKRGEKRKRTNDEDPEEEASGFDQEDVSEGLAYSTPRTRSSLKDNKTPVKTPDTIKGDTEPVKRGRGRPRKYPRPEEVSPQIHTPKQSPKKAEVLTRSSKKSAKSSAEVVPVSEESTRRRGRPRKIKPTTMDANFDWMGTPTARRTVTPHRKESSQKSETKVKLEPAPSTSETLEESATKSKPETEPDFQTKGKSTNTVMLEKTATKSKPEPPPNVQTKVKHFNSAKPYQGELYSEEKRKMWDKDPDGNFHCLHCDWSRPSSKSLLVHLRIHLDERPFICDQCAKGFRTGDKLRDHARTHTVERPFPCLLCGNAFKTNKALIRHQQIHAQDKYHKCDLCPKAFYTRERLVAHVSYIHEQVKKFGCSVETCDYRAAERKTILYHEAEKHGRPLPATLVTMCDVCGMSIRNSSLRMHKLIHAAKNLTCSVCSFATQYQNTLNGHMQRLHGINIDGTAAVKPFVCQICDEAFFSRQQLRFHDLRHQGAKPHKCPICDFATVDKGSMNMHIRTHTGATPYSCKHCSKSFKQSSALCWHIKTVHDGVRRYICDDCGKAYVNKKDLRAHRFSVHLKIKPFSCPNCHYNCTKKDYLAQHIERAHGPHLVPKELQKVRTFRRGQNSCKVDDSEAKYLVEQDGAGDDLPVSYSVVQSVLDQEQEAEGQEDVHPVVLVAPQTLEAMKNLQPQIVLEHDSQVQATEEAMATEPADTGDNLSQYEEAGAGTSQYEVREATTPHYIEVNPSTQQYTEEDPGTQQYTEQDPSTQQYAEEDPGTQQLTGGDPSTEQYTEQDPSTQQYTEDPSTQQYTEEDPSTQQLNEDPSTEQYVEVDPSIQQLTEQDPSTEQYTEDPGTQQYAEIDPGTEQYIEVDPSAQQLTEGDPGTQYTEQDPSSQQYAEVDPNAQQYTEQDPGSQQYAIKYEDDDVKYEIHLVDESQVKYEVETEEVEQPQDLY